MADAIALGAIDRKVVGVQVPSRAQVIIFPTNRQGEFTSSLAPHPLLERGCGDFLVLTICWLDGII